MVSFTDHVVRLGADRYLDPVNLSKKRKQHHRFSSVAWRRKLIYKFRRYVGAHRLFQAGVRPSVLYAADISYPALRSSALLKKQERLLLPVRPVGVAADVRQLSVKATDSVNYAVN